MNRKASFRYAISGLAHSFRSQVNLRYHLLIAGVVLLAGWWLGISLVEWSIVLICIGTVLAAELFNTALENHIDLTNPEWNEAAGRSKDIAAAAVLMVCLFTSVIGLVIFLPRIIERFS